MTDTAHLSIDRHIIDCTNQGNTSLTYAKRYRYRPILGDAGLKIILPNTGYTLVFAHSLASHKESWEPVVSSLFELENRPGQGRPLPKIKEMWTIDCPDHGESAALNAGDGQGPIISRVSCRSYGQAIMALVNSGLITEAEACPSRLFLIGHSAGATSVVLAVTLRPSLTFASIIYVEPWMISPELCAANRDICSITTQLVRSAQLRRDVWSDRAAARTYLGSKKAWQVWDDRVLHLYTKHALRSQSELPLSIRRRFGTESCVRLIFPRTLESEAYGDFTEGQEALKRLGSICRVFPVHAIFGERQPAVVKKLQRATCDPALGRHMASVTYLPGVEHMAPQQAPKQVAGAIWHILLLMKRQGAPIPLWQKL